MKNMSKRVVCFLLLVGTLAVLVSSCQAPSDNPKASNEGLITKEKLKSAVIVRADNASDYEADAATALKNKIKKKYGIELALKTDWIMRGEEEPKDFEIIIGNTNRELSKKVYGDFEGEFVYGIGCDKNKIALGADNVLSLNYALAIFELNFMKEQGIEITNGTLVLNKMSDSEISYMRENLSAGKYVGLTDTLDEGDKTHGKYKLIFSEEFNAEKINKNVWTHEYGYIANNELQCYNDREKNSYMDSDCLVIEAHKEEMNGFAYTSARLNTKGKFSFKYGYVEMRAILPDGQGIWPAFWMMGESYSWPACGEIDIMEKIGGSGREDTVHGTVHWGTSNPYNHMQYGLSTVSKEDLSEGFHTYAVEWTENEIKWFLDGRQFCVIDISGDQFSMFKQEFYILINLAVGGDWPGSPNATTKFPQQYIIDYIRVYQ